MSIYILRKEKALPEDQVYEVLQVNHKQSKHLENEFRSSPVHNEWTFQYPEIDW
jgi:hypothetical protein